MWTRYLSFVSLSAYPIVGLLFLNSLKAELLHFMVYRMTNTNRSMTGNNHVRLTVMDILLRPANSLKIFF